MSTLVTLMDASDPHSPEVHGLLEQQGYVVVRAGSPEELELRVSEADCLAVLVDLDLTTLGSSFFKRVRHLQPHLSVLTMSGQAFHPELKEAMTHHICACLRKPLDREELLFWLKAVADYAIRTRDPT
ncbi:MAG: response regulator [Thermodesulfobacteriota bacterium]